MKTVFTYFLFCCFFLSTYACHAQTSPIREIASVTYYSDSLGLYTYDSNYYRYSGSRGGAPVLQNNYWQYSGKYDTSYFLYKLGRGGKYYYSSRITEIFDGHSNTLNYLAQSYDTATSTWINIYQYLYSYDVNNNMLSSLYQSWDNVSSTWDSIDRNGYTYDANNNMLTDTSAIRISGAWRYSTLYLYSYDIHNNLTTYIDMSYMSGSWNNVEKYSYFLNAGYKPDSVIVSTASGPAWSNFSKDVYTYDGTYNQLTDTNYLWDNMSFVWKKGALHIYTYAGSDQLSNEYKTPLGDTAWQNSSYISNTYDANHNELRQVYQTWDLASTTYINNFSYANSFNANNKLDTMTYFSWDRSSSAWILSYREVFYYEPITGINNVNAAMSDIHLYPSPANSYMNLDIKWKTAQAAILAIYDMNGRLCRQWTADANINYHSNIPTANMPAGNYILKVSGDGGQVAEQFSVVH